MNLEIYCHHDDWLGQLRYLTGAWLNTSRRSNILIDVFWRGPRK